MDPVSIGLTIGGIVFGAVAEYIRNRKARRQFRLRGLALDSIIAGIELAGRRSGNQEAAKLLKRQVRDLATSVGIEHSFLNPAVQEIVQRLEAFGVFSQLHPDRQLTAATNAVRSQQ